MGSEFDLTKCEGKCDFGIRIRELVIIATRVAEENERANGDLFSTQRGDDPDPSCLRATRFCGWNLRGRGEVMTTKFLPTTLSRRMSTSVYN